MGLLTVVEGTHDLTTKNLNTYLGEHFPTSVKSWKKPYHKPVLLNHNSYSGTPVGRVKKAEVAESQVKKKQTAQRLVLDVTNSQIAAGILDGTYSTLSIGGSAESARCSICNTDILEAGWCGHLKGRKYDGKVCTWNIGVMEYEEISFVNVPADPYAQVIIPDLEAAAKEEGAKGEFARGILREYLNDNNERRTDGVNGKTAADIAKEVEEMMSGTQDPNGASSTTESTQQDPTNTSVDQATAFSKAIEALTAVAPKLAESKLEDTVVAALVQAIESVTKVASGETKLEEAGIGGKPADKELENKLATAESQIAGLTADKLDLQNQLETANKAVEPLKQQVEQSQKMAQQTMKLTRMLAVDRVVDLTITVEGKSPNDRETIATGLANKQLSDLVTEGQALAEKLPIPQRTPGKITAEGAGEDITEKPLEGAQNSGEEPPKTYTPVEAATILTNLFSGKKENN